MGLSTLRATALLSDVNVAGGEPLKGCDMTDREKLLTALLQESERRVGAEISVLDVMAMLDALSAEHRRAVRRVLCPAAKSESAGHASRRVATRSGTRSGRRTRTAAATERSTAASGVHA